MGAIMQRLVLVAGSFCVLVAALALASTGEGDALPGVERAFTEPVAPAAKQEERLISSGASRGMDMPLTSAVPFPRGGGQSDASLLAWSRFQPSAEGASAGR